MKKILFVCLLAMMMLFSLQAAADEAKNITASCTYSDGKNSLKKAYRTKLQDKDYKTYYSIEPRKKVMLESEKKIGGIFLQIFDNVQSLTIEAKTKNGWETVYTDPIHLTDWYPMPENTRAVRITNKSGSNLKIAEIGVYGVGDKPADVHQWRELEKSDLMLLVAHPDDDLLWFGGLLPVYAGEKGLDVQVVYMVPTGGLRKLEMLDALWTCGVTAYPGLLNFHDIREATLAAQYKRWGQKTVTSRIVEALRKYKPEVVVTHGEGGEYGHPAHKAASDTIRRAVQYAADSTNRPESYKAYGVWQVKKVYLHEYGTDQIVMDWHVPLEAFGGMDGLAVSQKAMECHASQVAGGWMVEDHGKHDNTLFGLAFSTVGADIEKNDFMENIELIKDIDQ